MRNILDNPIIDTDGYKPSHWLQYEQGTSKSFAYIAPRGGLFDKIVVFGLQPLLMKLQQRITERDVDEANELITSMGAPFNYNGWMHIVKENDGYLPVRIRALPEGSVVPNDTIIATIESTGGEETHWIVTWLETRLSRVWAPVNVATLSWHIKQDIMKYLRWTCDDPSSVIDFMLNDFGSRGVSSSESAALLGMGHLVNFKGSDTIIAVAAAKHYYGEKMQSYGATAAGYTIPAAEHSTITSWGRDNEAKAYENMLAKFAKPGAVLAIVSDSYDIYHSVKNILGVQLREKVIASGARVVVRPDSGDPKTVVLKVVQLLDEAYGNTLNKKGFKVLNHVRVIQGDGVNKDSINEIMQALLLNGYSIENVCFGMGGALLQRHERDTQKFAMKTSCVTVNGIDREVFKDPITDSGKKSLRGRLDVVKQGDTYKNVQIKDAHEQSVPGSAMHDVFLNGKCLNLTTLEAVRALASAATTHTNEVLTKNGL